MAGASLAAAPRARAGKVSPVARPGRTMPRLPLSLTPPHPAPCFVAGPAHAVRSQPHPAAATELQVRRRVGWAGRRRRLPQPLPLAPRSRPTAPSLQAGARRAADVRHYGQGLLQQGLGCRGEVQAAGPASVVASPGPFAPSARRSCPLVPAGSSGCGMWARACVPSHPGFNLTSMQAADGVHGALGAGHAGSSCGGSRADT